MRILKKITDGTVEAYLVASWQQHLNEFTLGRKNCSGGICLFVTQLRTFPAEPQRLEIEVYIIEERQEYAKRQICPATIQAEPYPERVKSSVKLLNKTGTS